MSLQTTNIIPITQARTKLGDLASLAIADNYFLLTKGGNPTVALVDFKYLKKLENIVSQMYQKTYIEPKLEKYSRNFSDQKIKEWQIEDQL